MKENSIYQLSHSYSQANKPGELLAIINSFDLLEIAMREGNAQQRLNVEPGDPVKIDLY